MQLNRIPNVACREWLALALLMLPTLLFAAENPER